MPIQELPPEILSEIFSHIWRPSDLKNICLTCRVLQGHAVSVLYRDVQIELGTGTSVWTSDAVKDHAISNFQYTQSLTLSPADTSAGKKKHTVYKDFMIVMDSIPINQLRKFKWSMGDRNVAPIRAADYQYLFKKQQNSQELTGCLIAGFDLALHALDASTEIFQSHTIRHLSVNLRSTKIWWSTLWQSFPKLDSFELEVIDTYIPLSVTDWLSPDLNTSVARASYSLAPKPAPLRLKRLAVRVPGRHTPTFNEYAAIVLLLFESFDLSALEHMTLENFSGADIMLHKMMETYKDRMPPITYLEMISFEREYSLWAVSKLLSQFLGLKTLKLAFRWREFRDKNCLLIPNICAHSSTLRTLFLSVRYSSADCNVDHWTSTTTGLLPDAMMDTLLSTCSNLEYLCLPRPCKRVVCSEHAASVLKRFTSRSTNVPNLHTLSITHLHCAHHDPPIVPFPNRNTYMTIDAIAASTHSQQNGQTLALKLGNPRETFNAVRSMRAGLHTLLLPLVSNGAEVYQAQVLVDGEPVVLGELRGVKYVEPGFREVEEWYMRLDIWGTEVELDGVRE